VIAKWTSGESGDARFDPGQRPKPRLEYVSLNESNGRIVLANTRSAKKRIRQTQRRRLHNRVFRTRARTAVREARVAAKSGDGAETKAKVEQAVSELDRAASKGVIHRNNAARRKSRLMKKQAGAQKKS
jgi:small subunit ribosomal protein S20